jgi:Asp-tRNA(Asn)/Glu-tRNA(Gln) amidotransferase C subunit
MGRPSPETLRRIAEEMAGVRIDDAEWERIAPALDASFGAIERLGELDLMDREPVTTFELREE